MESRLLSKTGLFFFPLSPFFVLFCFIIECVSPRLIWERMKRSLTNIYKAKVTQTLCYPFQKLANKVLQKLLLKFALFLWLRLISVWIWACLLFFPEPFGLSIVETQNRIRILKDHAGYLLSFRPSSALELFPTPPPPHELPCFSVILKEMLFHRVKFMKIYFPTENIKTCQVFFHKSSYSNCHCNFAWLE